MRLSEWNDRARFKCDDCHVHVVSHVCPIDETGGRPFALSPWHRRRRNVLFVHDQSVRSAKPFYGLVELADPVETNRTVAAIEDRPVTVGRDKGVTPWQHLVGLAGECKSQLAFHHEEDTFGVRVQFWFVASTSGGNLDDILRERFRKSRQRT